MVMRVYTARVSYEGDDRLDISRKGNDDLGIFFAPSKALFERYLHLRKNGLYGMVAVEANEKRYLAEMEERRRSFPRAWSALMDRKLVTLCCHCVNPSACHRLWLALFLAGHVAVYEGERE